MSVTDFECAIAKSQIGRYIAGDNLAPEVARQLESHINDCSKCKQLLQEKKNSLEAMIVDEETIKVVPDPIPMSQGSSALKPDYMEVLADSARKSLRDKLKDSPRVNSQVVEVPKVASAFAYKDEAQTETVKLVVETPKEPTKHKPGILSAFALYRDVPDDGSKPAMTKENIRAAKAVIRDNDPSMKKPMMYLAGLCAVVAAMSFVLRDPTSLFGGKVSAKASTIVTPSTGETFTKKTPPKVAKVLPHKTTKLNDKGIDAQEFTSKPAVVKKKPAAQKPVITKKKIAVTTPKPKISKVVAKPTPKLVHRPAPVQSKVRTQAQKFASTKPAGKHQSKAVHRKPNPQPRENTVKLYTPETTLQPQEQK